MQARGYTKSPHLKQLTKGVALKSERSCRPFGPFASFLVFLYRPKSRGFPAFVLDIFPSVSPLTEKRKRKLSEVNVIFSGGSNFPPLIPHYTLQE
ncbi:uncharacterized protein LAJ45_10211 [Morchella importuna]|uniref:uncharacterized protein n=1 Tax=Morchella importuna TaxID=1174673 RepID=UPI001E8E39C8|nr:uncharacterized protein LAJ45_10211 [Morchella importuna]KAH8145734.1 hypothetical protein LAJ45_10211 [Morchella importuna]